MSDSPFSKYGLFLIAAVLLIIALGTWSVRSRPAGEIVAENKNEDKAVRQQQRAQRAVALLFRAFHADNHLTYSAVSDTVAYYGGRKMEAAAHLTRAPESMSIAYTEGHQQGLRSGFNKRWFWRQKPGAPLEAYAEMQVNTVDMAAKRFALMLQNYKVELKAREEIEGLPVEVVELRPFAPLPGAKGPYKSLAIDEETGLALRVATFDHNAKPVMSTTLKKVDYTPVITADTFAPSHKIIEVARRKPWTAQDLGNNSDQVARLTGLQPPKPAYLPQGFRFDTVGVHHCSYKNAPYQAALARYTDGLNTLTVFAMQPETAKGLASCPPGAAGLPAKDKDTVAQTVSAPSTSGAVYQGGGGKGRACDFGAGSLVMRDTPKGRLIAVGDLPSPVLKRVLESASIVPVANLPKTSSSAPFR